MSGLQWSLKSSLSVTIAQRKQFYFMCLSLILAAFQSPKSTIMSRVNGDGKVSLDLMGKFLGAKAPLELAHVKNKKNNGTEHFLIAKDCFCDIR